MDVSEAVVWPEAPLKQEAKDVVYKFFALVDQNRPGVGDELATEVFASDGVFMTSTARFEGTAGTNTSHPSRLGSREAD